MQHPTRWGALISLCPPVFCYHSLCSLSSRHTGLWGVPQMLPSCSCLGLMAPLHRITPQPGPSSQTAHGAPLTTSWRLHASVTFSGTPSQCFLVSFPHLFFSVPFITFWYIRWFINLFCLLSVCLTQLDRKLHEDFLFEFSVIFCQLMTDYLILFRGCPLYRCTVVCNNFKCQRYD